MYRECTKFLGAAPPKETFLEADWCSLDNCNLAFDVVIGDKVFDNIPPKLWDSFKRSMSVCVISGGVLITRAAPQNKSLVGRTFSSLLEYWAGQFESSAVDLPHAVSGLWEQALGASASLGNAPLNQCISYFEAEINALKRDQSLRKSARQVLNEFLTFFGLTTSDSWTSYSLGMLIDFLGEEFMLESIKYSSDYVAATRQPILMFRRQ
jgi:hypothetical protein